MHPCHTNQVNRYSIHLIPAPEHQHSVIFFFGIFIMGLLHFFVANVCPVSNFALYSTAYVSAWVTAESHMVERRDYNASLELGGVKQTATPDQAGSSYSAVGAGSRLYHFPVPGRNDPKGLAKTIQCISLKL